MTPTAFGSQLGGIQSTTTAMHLFVQQTWIQQKLHWNRVVSTANARYMCLDIKKIYLTAALEYFE
jgi:hypothetical protein